MFLLLSLLNSYSSFYHYNHSLAHTFNFLILFKYIFHMYISWPQLNAIVCSMPIPIQLGWDRENPPSLVFLNSCAKDARSSQYCKTIILYSSTHFPSKPPRQQFENFTLHLSWNLQHLLSILILSWQTMSLTSLKTLKPSEENFCRKPPHFPV